MENLRAVRWGVLLQEDGLDEDGMISTIDEDYGTVCEVMPIMLDDDTPCKIFIVESTLFKFLRFKIDANCVGIADNNYILVPMANKEEKEKMIAAGFGK